MLSTLILRCDIQDTFGRKLIVKFNIYDASKEMQKKVNLILYNNMCVYVFNVYEYKYKFNDHSSCNDINVYWLKSARRSCSARPYLGHFWIFLIVDQETNF